MEITKDTVVTIHYTLKNDAGEVLDSSKDREPLAFVQGAGNIIPGLESAVLGSKEGEELDVTVKPEDAYGEHDQEAIRELPRQMFQGIDKLEEGMRLQAETEQGPLVMKVTEVKDDTIVVDTNHELAGQTLHFAVKIDGVREATSEEVDHGHAH